MFTSEEWEGEPAESEEMNPKWYPIDSIPYVEMWADDAIWLPQVLAGEVLRGRFWFDEHDAIVRYDLEN